MVRGDRLLTSRLQLYLDTVEVQHWQTWFPTGMFYGVTSNPLLLERAGVPCRLDTLKDLARQALDLGAREVQIQTWGATVDEMVATGQQLGAIAPEIVVKVPVTRLGTEATAQLVERGVRTTLTGVYTAHQALIAIALGVEYAAPYLGRINDAGRNGREEIATMGQAIIGVDSSLRLLVASIRSVEDILYLTAQGLDTFTFSAAIAAEFFDVAATNQAAIDFEAAAQRMKG